MIVRCLLVLGTLGSSAFAGWDPVKDARRIGQNAKEAVSDFGKKTEKELNNAKRDAERHFANQISGGFAPWSRRLPDDRPIGDDTFWMAVVGDSSVTGAVASPRFVVTAERTAQILGDLLIGKQDRKLEARIEDFADPARFNVFAPIDPLLRTLYTRAEYERERTRHGGFDLAVQSKFSLAFDTEEYAFPYLIGRALSIPAPHIVLAAQDGKKISAMGEQLARVLEVPGVRTLPPLLVVSFVANDMCHPDNFDRPLDHFVTNFARDVHEQFANLAKLPPAKVGTRVMVVAPLDVSWLLTDPELLNQQVKFENAHDATCRSIHDGTGVHGDVAKKLQSVLIGACRGILSPGGDPAARVQRIRDMQAAQLDVLRTEIAAFAGPEFRVQLATSAKALRFRAGDVANDCFHPSARGHERIAAELLRGEFADLRGILK